MHSDVVIVGGGVIGCSIAYHLAQKGVKVTVLERDAIGRHASSAAAGMLGAQSEMNVPGPLVSACIKSRALFPDLREALLHLSRLDIELSRFGILKVAFSESEAEALKQKGKWQRAWGQAAHWLSRTECLELEPSLSAEMVGALHLPDDHQVSAPRLTSAFAQSASRLGATLVEGCHVMGFEMAGRRLVRVLTSQGSWTAGHVVLAAGAWTGWLAERLGISLPMTPVKGESLALKTNHLPLRYTVFGTDGYLVPKASGEIVVGATEVPGQMSQGVSAQATQALLSMALRYVPALADATVTRVYASVRPGSPDGLPYIGKWEGIENLYIATGHYRNGILLSPLTGEWITRMIMGEESEEWKPFSPMRLAKQEGGVR